MAAAYRLWRHPSASEPAERPKGPPAAAEARPPGGPSVAVLPFTNLSPNRENEYFSDGVTEELITALGRVQGLRVAARASSFAFKGKPMDVGEVSRKLDVAAVLDGSVRRAGTRLRVTAELVQASDGTRLWAESYDRELRDVFAVQDELARAIVGALRGRLELPGGAAGGAVRPPTRDLVAHDLYLEGRYVWNQRTYESLLRAATFFERATARDATYAEAYAGLGGHLRSPALLRPDPAARRLPQGEARGRAGSRSTARSPRRTPRWATCACWTTSTGAGPRRNFSVPSP